MYDAMEIIKARDALEQIKISSFSKMKPENQKKYQRSLYKKAYPPKEEEFNLNRINKLING